MPTQKRDIHNLRTATRIALRALRGAASAAAADRGFDGGEFSGPAHADMLTKEIDDIACAYGYDGRVDMISRVQAVCEAVDAGEWLYNTGLLQFLDDRDWAGIRPL